MIGQRIAHYLIESQIGQGGMGVVYKARDTELNRWVAIKAIHPELLVRQPIAVKRLREEASVTASLDHPYICKVFEVLDYDNRALIVMEWVQGKTLKELIREGLTQGEALRYFTELAEALESTHKQQVVHRDIKPSNVMVTQHGHVKLMDFGLVKLLRTESDISSRDTTSLTAPRTMLGTFHYMSPEQASGDPVDQRSDLFSLGIVMFEALTGKLPFRGADHRSYLHDLLNGQPRQISRLREGVRPELQNVIMRCLAKDPAERFHDSGELVEALQKIRVEDRRRHWLAPALFVLFSLVLALVINRFWWVESPVSHSFPVLESLATGPGDKFGSRISPNGEWISFLSRSRGRTALNISRVGGGKSQTLIEDEAISSQVWSPDGMSIAYLSEAGSEVHLRLIEAPIHSGGPIRDEVLSGPLGPQLIRWIGPRLYLSSYQAVWRFDLDRSELKQVTEKPPMFEFWRQFDVSPDEKHLAFSAVVGHQEDLFVADLDGSQPIALTDDEATQEAPRWLGSDAREIVFSSNRGGQTDLWQVDVKGKVTRQLTSSRFAEYVNDTSADGYLISFEEIQQESDLWTFLTGESPRQVTANTRLDLWPSISGRRMAFQRSSPAGLKTGTHFFDAEILLGEQENGELRAPDSLSSGFAPYLVADGRWLFFFRLVNQGRYRTELWVRDLQSGREQAVHSRFQLSGVVEFPTELLARTLAWSEQARALFFVALSENDSPQILKYEPESSQQSVLLTSFQMGEELRDIYLSPSEDRLSFLHWVREDDQEQQFKLYVLDLESGKLEEWAAWTEGRLCRLLSRGWFSKDSLVMIHSRFADPSVESDKVSIVSAQRESPPLAQLTDVFGVSFRLSQDRQRLFFTGIEDGISNVFQLSLPDGEQRRITSNIDETVSFSSLSPTASGRLFYAQQQRKLDIGLLRYAP